MRSLDFPFEIILPSVLWHLGRLNFKVKLIQGIHLRVKGGRLVCKADVTDVCENCLENAGASMFHSPMGLHGLLQRQLYLFFHFWQTLLPHTSLTQKKIYIYIHISVHFSITRFCRTGRWTAQTWQITAVEAEAMRMLSGARLV
jgi:hypothetical protein